MLCVVSMKATTTIFILTTALVALSGCSDPEVGEPEVEYATDAEWMMAHADDFMTDRAFRRAELEAMMWRPELPYAEKLLSHYGRADGGWEYLPQLAVRTQPVMAEEPGAAFAPTIELTGGVVPTTEAEWIALGEQVFTEMPMRRDAYLEWLVLNPQVWDEVGIEVTDDGRVAGFMRFEDTRGRVRVGITCSACHAAGGVPGQANTKMNLGLARALFAEAQGQQTDESFEWGPGKVDITDDGVTDPLAIPNLWGVDAQEYINASGVIRQASPASLAVRFETQYIINHSFEARPPRVLAWALAMYVRSLDAPASPVPADGELVAEGREIFEASCAGCHDGARKFSGALVRAEALTSDPLAAASLRRGTGFYKVPSLEGIGAAGGPFLHDASSASLDDLLTAGHPAGGVFGLEERRALLAYLDTL